SSHPSTGGSPSASTTAPPTPSPPSSSASASTAACTWPANGGTTPSSPGAPSPTPNTPPGYARGWHGRGYAPRTRSSTPPPQASAPSFTTTACRPCSAT